MRNFFKGMTMVEFVLFLFNPIRHVRIYRRVRVVLGLQQNAPIDGAKGDAQ